MKNQLKIWAIGLLLVLPNFNQPSDLIDAARRNDLALVQRLINADANVNFQDPHGETALMSAVINNNAQQVVKLLLNAGADVNVQNMHGNTALIWAALNNHAQVVVLLLNTGAAPLISNNKGETALGLTKDPKIIELIANHIATTALEDSYL